MIKLTNKQEATIEFVHVNGLPSSLHIVMNPLTGDWIQTHKIAGQESSYVGDRYSALHLANNIIKTSKEKNLPCKVTIQNRKVLLDL